MAQNSDLQRVPEPAVRCNAFEQELTLLLVEDNSSDVFFVKEALKADKKHVNVIVASDGVEALSLLRSVAHLDLIILDLNLPRLDGFGVLAEHGMRHVPIVIFSSSRDPAEVQKSLSLGAAGFVHKPTDLDEFLHAVRQMVDRYSARAPAACQPCLQQ